MPVYIYRLPCSTDQPYRHPNSKQACEGVVRSHPGFRSAIQRAGYDPDKVMIDPWSVGES